VGDGIKVINQSTWASGRGKALICSAAAGAGARRRSAHQNQAYLAVAASRIVPSCGWLAEEVRGGTPAAQAVCAAQTDKQAAVSARRLDNISLDVYRSLPALCLPATCNLPLSYVMLTVV